jgi:hypothetical protein
MRVFPAFAAAEGGLCTEAQDACTLLGEAQLDRVTAPTKHTFSPAGVAATVFQRHVRLKGAPCGSRHFRGS